jgi:hypothetical protein
MSDLEGATRDILISLIAGTRFFDDLNAEERHNLARWTMKTAAALNKSSPYGTGDAELARAIPDEHLRIVKAGGVPSEVLIVGTIYPASSKKFDFLQFARWANPKNSIPLNKEDMRRSYKVALSFGQLVLIASYYPSNDYAYAISTQRMFTIWTKRRVVPVDHIWNTSGLRSASPFLEVHIQNIAVISHAWQSLVDSMAFTRFVH